MDTGLSTTSQLAQGPTLVAGDGGWSPYRWWWFWYSRSELRDDRVVLFADYLNKGTYEYVYTLRAASPGQFNVIPTFANETYLPRYSGAATGCCSPSPRNSRYRRASGCKHAGRSDMERRHINWWLSGCSRISFTTLPAGAETA